MTAEPDSARPAAASDLIATLRGKAPRLALALAAGQMAWPGVRKLRHLAEERTTYTVKVPGNDDLFDDLHAWVLSLLPPSEQRALVAWCPRGRLIAHYPGDAVPDKPEETPALRLRYDGTREQAITVAGHRIMVSVNGPAAMGSPEERRWQPPEIVFTARSLPARDALLSEIAATVEVSRSQPTRPTFRMLDKWGDWTTVDNLPPRDLDSVILPAGQLDRLTGDVERFLAHEQDYLRRCIPWHRGHLYTGPPGTGKTSVARAIASHFNLNVWYLPLADVKNDGSLLRTIGQVGPRSMLLLEDVDVFHVATRRDDDDGATLSGLLNSLDGLATPHGLLTVLTSNRPGVLDDALIRPGRVDLVEEFSLAGPDEIRRIIGRWYGQPPPQLGDVQPTTPAQVIELCKQHATMAAAAAHVSRRNTVPV